MKVEKIITDRIIEKLAAGEIPWRKPWIGTNAAAYNDETGDDYSALNQLTIASTRGIGGPYLSYKQIQARGGHVRKGAHAAMVTFWRVYDVSADNAGDAADDDATDNNKPEKRFVLRYYNVFSLADCDGVAVKHPRVLADATNDNRPDVRADHMIANYLHRNPGLTLRHARGNAACYSPATDMVTIPERDQFTGVNEYYSTAFHELTHSTLKAGRCNRESEARGRFGSQSYSREELTAEIGAAALTNMAGLETPETFDNSAAYIKSWLHVLADNPTWIVSASGRAQKAVDYITDGLDTASMANLPALPAVIYNLPMMIFSTPKATPAAVIADDQPVRVNHKDGRGYYTISHDAYNRLAAADRATFNKYADTPAAWLAPVLARDARRAPAIKIIKAAAKINERLGHAYITPDGAQIISNSYMAARLATPITGIETGDAAASVELSNIDGIITKAAFEATEPTTTPAKNEIQAAALQCKANHNDKQYIVLANSHHTAVSCRLLLNCYALLHSDNITITCGDNAYKPVVLHAGGDVAIICPIRVNH